MTSLFGLVKHGLRLVRARLRAGVLGAIFAALALRGIAPARAPEYSLLIVQDHSKSICRIDNMDRFTVVAGQEERCWREVVQAHNSSMERGNHQLADKILQIVAIHLAKP